LSAPARHKFDTTTNANICAWKRAIKLASVDDQETKTLGWQDLRRETASPLFEKGLHPMEVASITGHRSMQMLQKYAHLKPENLLEKLG
jgi:site-specific recombinase XerD